MKKKLFILALSVMTLLVSIQPSLAAADNTNKVVYRPNDDVLQLMSYFQAKRKIESMENRHVTVEYQGHNHQVLEGTHIIKDIKISSDKVTWTENYPCEVRNENYQWLWCSGTSYFKSMKIDVVGCCLVDLGNIKWSGPGPGISGTYFSQKFNRDEAVSLASAFYVLKRYAEGYRRDDSAAEAAFANKAKRYREMPVKPTLPEDVQRYRIVAEDAFNNKDFEKALDYYKKGLGIEPLWPQGQFNAAMLAGELRWYDWAVLHMKRYLELVPDAANAKAAREKMYLWEEKAKEEMQKVTGAGK